MGCAAGGVNQAGEEVGDDLLVAVQQVGGGGLEAFGQEGVEEVDGVAGSGQLPGPELVVTSGGFEEDRRLGREKFEEFLQVGGRGGEGAGGNYGGLGREQAGAGGA